MKKIWSKVLAGVLAFLLTGCGVIPSSLPILPGDKQTEESNSKAVYVIDTEDDVARIEESRRKAEEQAKEEAEKEAARKAAEEARIKAEEEARKKAEEEAKRKAEEEARRIAEEEARIEAEKKEAADNCVRTLNYLGSLTEKIINAKNGKLYLEEAEHSLENNTNLTAIKDKKTQEFITNLYQKIQNLRMNEYKRDRLTFLYEQKKANSIWDAVPSPLSVKSVVDSGNPLKSLLALTFLAIDSFSNFTSKNEKDEFEFLKDEWVLDKYAMEEISKLKTEIFAHRLTLVNEKELDSNSVLNSEKIENFVKWKNETNFESRLLFLENNKSDYSEFGEYWLVLSKTYYEKAKTYDKKEDYVKCVSAMDTYLEKTKTPILNIDVELANALPYAISALEKVYDGKTLIEKELVYVDSLLTNSKKDWSLQYYAAITYTGIYDKTKNKTYLEKAYDIIKHSVNELLIAGQLSQNKQYCEPVQEQEAPKNASKEDKKKIEDYNKSIKDARKTELPPIDSSLILNLQLLFSLADELKISEEEKKVIDEVLHGNEESLFLIDSIDSFYSFSKNGTGEVTGTLDGNKLTIPAVYVCDKSKIEVTVTHDGVQKKYTDWKIEEVKRPKAQGPEKYEAIFSCEDMKKESVGKNDTAVVKIYPLGDDIPPLELHFAAKEKKILFITNYEWALTE